MNKNILYGAVVLVLVIIGGTFYMSKNKNAGQPSVMQTQPVVAENTYNPVLSEQPDQAKFAEYFTNINLAKLPVGAQFDPRQIVRTNSFLAGEQFCTNMDMKKQIPASTMSSAIYDASTKETGPRSPAFPQAMGPGNSVGCENLSHPAGQYEFKIYFNDVLVSVLPFEVK